MNADAVIHRNNVRVLGRTDGPALLLAQGFGCDQVIWDRILPFFTDTYKVVLFDHVGTGGADPDAYGDAKYAAFEGYLADLIEIIDVLELDDATVVGHSIAGTMALAAATRSPRIARLVLLCASPCYVNDEGYSGGLQPEDIEAVLQMVEVNYPLWARAMAPEIAGAEPGSEVSGELAENMCRLRPEYVRDFLEMSFAADVRQLLPQVSVPALILQSPGDPLTPEPASLFLHSHLSQSTRVDLLARGNMPHLSSPRETAGAILEYLEASTRA
ncbi:MULTISPECIES: alpha/beta hydrolase [unclassified Arthrobacter]|uniref:alpha/beta fold hydrolase n=1 Tax=unclassified Arthrobacter TaxID=235627 RepID=UPI001E2C71FA|nr:MULTISPECIES: alpha/beta hydrolase [unclassified Arthrobacter]MCC9144451.1 alpha/beta hydrolase [Arthrobacter sp. zg-Y919]MDK1275677.1 alpha/beta hydrolase [Arthrobacter sp. zg.Y919]WIB02955.1 alpha/beta hydrolase [Arthrobacter sp. zg-Y919]